MKGHSILFALAAALSVASFASVPAHAGNIVEEWSSVKVPPPPKLEPVTVDPKTTAVLALDFVPPICNEKRRPRCVASLPAVAKLIANARKAGALVVYSGVGSTPKDKVLKEVAPTASEPFVQSHADKFMDTDLDKILKDHGIKTVIVTGVTAEGAVLYTASDAALRGFHVIVPVDGMSASNPYAEQYVAWNMVNAPLSPKPVVTSVDMIKF